jgi:hypothetical protein
MDIIVCLVHAFKRPKYMKIVSNVVHVLTISVIIGFISLIVTFHIWKLNKVS